MSLWLRPYRRAVTTSARRRSAAARPSCSFRASVEKYLRQYTEHVYYLDDDEKDGTALLEKFRPEAIVAGSEVASRSATCSRAKPGCPQRPRDERRAPRQMRDGRGGRTRWRPVAHFAQGEKSGRGARRGARDRFVARRHKAARRRGQPRRQHLRLDGRGCANAARGCSAPRTSSASPAARRSCRNTPLARNT